MKCKLFDFGTLNNYKIVMVISQKNGRLLLSRPFKKRSWEPQTCTLLPGENVKDCAERAIKESFSEFNGELKPLCDFWFGNTRSGNNGTVFAADITDVDVIGEVKHPSDKTVIEETRAFSKLPRTLIYPRITTEILIYMINKGIANLTLLPQALITAKA